jgi:glucose dehydrogenase
MENSQYRGRAVTVDAPEGVSMISLAPSHSAAGIRRAAKECPAAERSHRRRVARLRNGQKELAVREQGLRGQRFVDLKRITTKNVNQLRPVCIYRSNYAGATQANPLVYRGVMYLTIDKAIVAIDAATCRERWTYNWEAKGAVLSATNRGVALQDGRVVRGTADG